MIDLRAARADPDPVRVALARKGAAGLFDELLEADASWRGAVARVDALRAATKSKGRPSDEERAAMSLAKSELRDAEGELSTARERLDELLARVPNPPDPSVPDGASDEDAEELRRVGALPVHGFAVRDHVELGGFDLERGARLSGARFAYRVGPVALVELALYRYALEAVGAKGHVPVLPPVLVREEAMYGTGFLPTERSNLYVVEPDGMYLTGTSEVALAAMHLGEVLSGADLPVRYAGYSTCFRREAGAAGRDTRGIFRVHQFDKVEMFSFVEPDSSRDEHERMLAIEEELVQGLGLAYRVVNVAAGDLGAPAAKKYDIEAWIPSQGRYREITSCSNDTDYQARRLSTRYRASDGEAPRHVHTLNGTAMTARWLIALLETYQDESGSVTIPEPLVALGAPARVDATGR
ncbi:MAG: serine--tRNA ligase [Actinomycetota bacterium]|nr:serine--tRNA ligase [Actinomycetota bacterium]